jgi:hypothetical protein
MRGSDHEKSVREYWIDDDGVHLGERMEDNTGILGSPGQSLGGSVSYELPPD